MIEDLILLTEVALSIAGLGIIASVVLGLKYHQPTRVEAKLEQALDAKMLEVYMQEVPKKRAYYNVRCHCGRFAKRVLGTESVIDCKRHGVEVDWNKVDIDWIYKPISTTEIGIQVDFLYLEMAEELPAITSPIQIIHTDEAFELEVLDRSLNDRKLLLSHS